MTGPLSLAGDPTAGPAGDLHAVPRRFVDGRFLPLTGGTLTGNVNFQNDGEGIGFFGGAWLRKVSGTGLVFRLHTNDTLQVENNNGGNRRPLLDTNSGDARYLRSVQGGFLNITGIPTNFWTNVLARCREIMGGRMVYLEINATFGSTQPANSWRDFGTLPAGHRPGRRLFLWARATTPPASGNRVILAGVEINTNGVINIRTLETVEGSSVLELVGEFALETQAVTQPAGPPGRLRPRHQPAAHA
jgi:hypothetical protein